MNLNDWQPIKYATYLGTGKREHVKHAVMKKKAKKTCREVETVLKTTST